MSGNDDATTRAADYGITRIPAVVVDGRLAAGGGAAGLTRAVKAPMLLAVVCGIIVTALLRLQLS